MAMSLEPYTNSITGNLSQPGMDGSSSLHDSFHHDRISMNTSDDQDKDEDQTYLFASLLCASHDSVDLEPRNDSFLDKNSNQSSNNNGSNQSIRYKDGQSMDGNSFSGTDSSIIDYKSISDSTIVNPSDSNTQFHRPQKNPRGRPPKRKNPSTAASTKIEEIYPLGLRKLRSATISTTATGEIIKETMKKPDLQPWQHQQFQSVGMTMLEQPPQSELNNKRSSFPNSFVSHHSSSMASIPLFSASLGKLECA